MDPKKTVWGGSTLPEETEDHAYRYGSCGLL